MFEKRTRRGGKLKAGLLTVSVLALLAFLVRGLLGGPPELRLSRDLGGIGLSTTVSLTATDAGGLRSLDISLEQNGRRIPILAEDYATRWALRHTGPEELSRELRIGITHQPGLADGEATLHILAQNLKWFGGEARLDLPLAVRSRPPVIEVLSGLLHVNQGGSEMVLYRVSETATESGVRVGKYFFPGYRLPGSGLGERAALFAFPYDLPVETPAQIVARDDADNEALANFPHRVAAKRFRSRDIQISDSFLETVVPAILSSTPEAPDQGGLLKNFLYLNGTLREVNRSRIAEIARQTAPELLWDGPFHQLANSAVESQFADFRTYFNNGEKVDEQVHLGFDLASTQQVPVQASNSGQIIFAEYLGIFGNTVIVDHGLGLQTLYAHLSSFDIGVGDGVAKGQTLGRSGSTGMAGGDHLHFTTLLNGIEVNAIEWWDKLWIEQHILARLGQ